MDDEKQFVTPPEAPGERSLMSAPHKNRKITTALLIVLGLILLGAGGYGSYRYGASSSKSDSSQAQSTATNTDKSSNNTKQAEGAVPSFHTVIFGSLDRDPKVSIKLAFPQDYQAIAYDNGPDTFRSLFGDNNGTSTYHGGNWEVGNPDDGDGNTWGSIGVMGIANDWYTRNGFATYGGYNGDSYAADTTNTTINGYDFSTAKMKKDSLDKLISDTSACIKDPAKGFTISGGFNVCYTPILIKQAYAAYSPKIEVSGYASIKGAPYVMFGYLDVKGGLDGYAQDALNKAGDDFKAGNIPAPTQKNIDVFVAALKHSSVASQ